MAAPFRRIVHPTDFSRASSAAFARAVALAREGRAELLVVHVLAPVAPLLGDGYVSPGTYEALERAARKSAEAGLGRLVAKARKAGARASSLLLAGVPHAEIVRAARRRRADLIVVGTHGRTGLSHLFLGSVAERVVQLASCSVLTVRGR